MSLCNIKQKNCYSYYKMVSKKSTISLVFHSICTIFVAENLMP